MIWREECPGSQTKLISRDEGRNQNGEIHVTELETEAEFDTWNENGYEAARYDGEVYVKHLTNETDYEVLSLEQFNALAAD